MVVGIVYVCHITLLFAFAVNWLYLSLLTIRRRGPDPVAPPSVDHPMVTVQLPIYNELYVAERVIEAAARLDWPVDRLEIQVLDDSTDETMGVVDAVVASVRLRGIAIEVVRRPSRVGFKAGALAAGMQTARGELIAYFDADFVPPPDFLHRTVPHFADPGIAFVQTRWGHINRSYSPLTILQSVLLDGHFGVDQFARHRAGYCFNFNGTAGVWRRSALESAGGWSHDTLSEDVDVSYRAFLASWRARYLREVETPAELPVTMAAFRRQQDRWATGNLQCARKLLPRIWRAALPLPVKLQASLHLLGHTIHLSMFALTLVYPFILFFAFDLNPEWIPLFVILGLFGVAAATPGVYYGVAQHELGGSWRRRLPVLLLIAVFGCGMMMTTVRAAWRVARRRGRAFERTPKFGIARRSDTWLGRKYMLDLDPLVLVELVVIVWSAALAAYAFAFCGWMLALFGVTVALGTLFVAGLSVVEAVRTKGRPREAVISPAAPPSGLAAG